MYLTFKNWENCELFYLQEEVQKTIQNFFNGFTVQNTPLPPKEQLCLKPPDFLFVRSTGLSWLLWWPWTHYQAGGMVSVPWWIRNWTVPVLFSVAKKPQQTPKYDYCGPVRVSVAHSGIRWEGGGEQRNRNSKTSFVWNLTYLSTWDICNLLGYAWLPPHPWILFFI